MDRNLRDEIKDLNENLARSKRKNFKIPLKARLNKRHLEKGFITILEISENRSINFRREPVIDGTVKLYDTIHAVEDLDYFYHKGKPMILMPKNKANPWNPLREDNETYGQKYIMARMKSDLITAKKKINAGALFLVLGALAVGAYFLLGGTGG